MKKIIILVITMSFLAVGCIVVPEGHCPPGQAKKGNC